jgi:branched-chain amino acid transport system substrate-binding protein
MSATSYSLRVRHWLLGSIILVSLTAAGAMVAHAVEPVRVGAVFSMSAKSGFGGPLMGAPMKMAVTAVVDDLNAKGGILGRPIELYVEDDQSSPTSAAVAATKLIRDRKVSVVIGPSLTDSAMAMIPVCEKEQVPMVVTGPATSSLDKWVFLVGAGDIRGAAHIADFAVKTLGVRKIAVLHDSANYGMTGMKNLVRQIARHPDVSIVIEEQFAPSDTNMIPQLTKIKAANPELLILYTTGASAAIIAKNYKQLGMVVQVLGSHGVPTPEFLSLAGKTAEEHRWVMIGAKIAVADRLPVSDPYRKNVYDPFIDLMKKEYSQFAEPNVYQAAAYDGIMITTEALKAAGTDDRAALRNALEHIRWNGLLGEFSCTPRDHQGSPRDDSAAMMVREGRYVPYKK